MRNLSISDRLLEEVIMATKRFSPAGNFNKTNISKVPTGKPVVYELVGESGDNIYVGSAKRGRSQERLQDHMPGGPDPIPASKFRVKQTGSIQEAQREEKRIIEKEKPKYNKA